MGNITSRKVPDVLFLIRFICNWVRICSTYLCILVMKTLIAQLKYR